MTQTKNKTTQTLTIKDKKVTYGLFAKSAIRAGSTVEEKYQHCIGKGQDKSVCDAARAGGYL